MHRRPRREQAKLERWLVRVLHREPAIVTIAHIRVDAKPELLDVERERFVTGVTWVEGELWHGTWEGEDSDVRRIDPRTGEVLERIEMPPGVHVSGLESDGGDRFFCGDASSGKVRAIRRPSHAGTPVEATRKSSKRPPRAAVRRD